MSTIWVKPFLVSSLLCGFVLPSQAQVGTPNWHFKNRAEVEAATRKHKMNLRESYNIIMCAKRQGMIRSVVRVYEQDMPSNPFNVAPQVASSFALAHDMMRAPVRWDWPHDRQKGMTNLSQSDGIRITLHRDRAIQALPNSPEVLLAYAIWSMENDEREEALKLTTKALRFAPKWAELNWWHAIALQYRLMGMSMTSMKKRKQEEPRYGTLMLRFLNKAEQLDPAFKQENLIIKSSAYAYTKQYKEALAAYDGYIRYKPRYRNYIGEQAYVATRKFWSEKAIQSG